jgi:diguanylate cyclase (GGDEF)-like protein/PAS domain S-box-containing protein
VSAEPGQNDGLHPLLSRQLRRLRLDEQTPPTPAQQSGWKSLLGRVSTAYGDADRERYTLERSIDVTSTEMAELYEQLGRREAAVRAIVDNAAEAILTVEDGGLITSFNPAAEQMYGWSEAQILGQRLSVLVPGHLWIPIDGAPGASAVVEGVCRRRDASTLPVLASVGFQQAEHGTIATVIVRDISERKTFEAKLAHQAGHDALTGLPTRALFGELLQEALASAQRRGTELAVLFCDLNRFKMINDSLGHEAGDNVLIAAAGRLRAAVRAGDTVARLSGDEFVIVCEDVGDSPGAEKIAARIHTEFARPLHLNGRRIHLSCSVGIAYGSGRSSDEVLRNADMAMYRAKKAGAGLSAVFDDALHSWASHRLDIENGLRRALERGELRLHYQPIVRTGDGVVEYVEALVRWYRPGHGLVSPADFLPIAEEAGLIRRIDEWVLSLACAEAVGWSTPVPIAVNFSPMMFAQPGAADLVAATLAESGLPPERLAIEVPETLLGESMPVAAEMLTAIRALGVGIHLDDFGAQYSSLGRLRDLKLDMLKIDRTFIAKIDDPTNRAIVQAVIGLAHALGLRTVAEGVETVEQLRELQSAGCDFVQGYLFARPLIPQRVPEFIMQAARPRAARPAVVERTSARTPAHKPVGRVLR